MLGTPRHAAALCRGVRSEPGRPPACLNLRRAKRLRQLAECSAAAFASVWHGVCDEPAAVDVARGRRGRQARCGQPTPGRVGQRLNLIRGCTVRSGSLPAEAKRAETPAADRSVPATNRSFSVRRLGLGKGEVLKSRLPGRDPRTIQPPRPKPASRSSPIGSRAFPLRLGLRSASRTGISNVGESPESLYKCVDAVFMPVLQFTVLASSPVRPTSLISRRLRPCPPPRPRCSIS
jgi:hypothetical protein